jgi:hypothetical protein
MCMQHARCAHLQEVRFRIMEVPDSTIQFGNFVHKMDFEEIQNPKFNSNI